MAKAEAVTTIVDNSWATPIFQKPLQVGIDLVVHSASKYISGHSDTVAGLLVGKQSIIDQLAAETTPYLGASVLGLFQDGYRERGLAPENLSRSLEVSVTILEPLMLWTVSAIFMATTLGVPTLQYLPWAVFCLTGWIFSLLLAALFPRTGFGLKLLECEAN